MFSKVCPFAGARCLPEGPSQVTRSKRATQMLKQQKTIVLERISAPVEMCVLGPIRNDRLFENISFYVGERLFSIGQPPAGDRAGHSHTIGQSRPGTQGRPARMGKVLKKSLCFYVSI